jgi:hypothetical protein
MIARVQGLKLTHVIQDDGGTACGHDASTLWPASGEATCAECVVRPMLDDGNVPLAVHAVLQLPSTPDKAIAASITQALSSVVAARLRA